MQAVFVQVNEATMNHNIRIETGVIMDQEFWKDKKVLITGNNGFKGCWLNKWLDMMGADTLGISLPAEKESIYHELRMSERHCYQELDIRNYNMLEQAVKKFRPEIVFHLAAQAIVRTAKEEPVETFSANLMGTVNLLEALRHCDSIRAAVVVTSDKVYENTDDPNWAVMNRTLQARRARNWLSGRTGIPTLQNWELVWQRQGQAIPLGAEIIILTVCCLIL